MTRNKHGFKGPAPVARNSTRHVALGVLKISDALTPAELFEFNPRKFVSVRHSEKILEEMASKNWAARTDAGFVLTVNGRKILSEMAARSPFRGSSG